MPLDISIGLKSKNLEVQVLKINLVNNTSILFKFVSLFLSSFTNVQNSKNWHPKIIVL